MRFLSSQDGTQLHANLLVFGPQSTGKTAVVRDVLKEGQVPFAYASCIEHDTPQGLLRSIFRQLKGRKRKADGHAAQVKVDSLEDFMVQIPGIAPSHVVAGGHAPVPQPTRFVIVDHAHHMADVDALATLLRMRELTGANVSVILIAHQDWASNIFQHDTLKMVRPLRVFFPAYKEEELVKILATGKPADAEFELYMRFLRTLMPHAMRVSRRVEAMAAEAARMWAVYLQPVTAGRVQASQGTQLWKLFMEHLRAETQAGQRQAGLAPSTDAAGPPGIALDFEVPYLSKFLLLAAYVASRNDKKLDRRMFDAGATSGRRRGAMAADKQAEAAKEAALKGTGSFPLARLLAIFGSLLEQQAEEVNFDTTAPREQQAVDVYMQISSLVALRLLSQVSGDPLEDAKYKCNISDDLAKRIARNVKLDLGPYLLYA
ncbi:hypothetical protein WJX72_009173 [[Myrmecia] bisecta]|uniref:AAA+ ATPase domain-containing protein n=1 Tax=[Myrmecia] bisecta TaxID=41462 RepID=A0AAW1QSN9_9CHLO